MTAVHTVTVRCDGHLQKGCPSAATLTLEVSSNSDARYEAGLAGWSWRWGAEGAANANNRKKIDICPDCDPVRRRTR